MELTRTPVAFLRRVAYCASAGRTRCAAQSTPLCMALRCCASAVHTSGCMAHFTLVHGRHAPPCSCSMRLVAWRMTLRCSVRQTALALQEEQMPGNVVRRRAARAFRAPFERGAAQVAYLCRPTTCNKHLCSACSYLRDDGAVGLTSTV
eukprot:366033-Chlamydomonas_euryale.AAC.4